MNQILQTLVSIFTSTMPVAAGANPVVSLGLFALEEAIKQEPDIAAELKQLFASDTVTPEMLAALRAKIASESYAGFVPASALPASNVTPTAGDGAAAAGAGTVTGGVNRARLERVTVRPAATLIMDGVVHYLQPDGTYVVTPPVNSSAQIDT